MNKENQKRHSNLEFTKSQYCGIPLSSCVAAEVRFKDKGIHQNALMTLLVLLILNNEYFNVIEVPANCATTRLL
jgi:hypothetical protein